MNTIITEIIAERERQKESPVAPLDKTNTESDFIALVCAYAASGAPILNKGKRPFREAMVKAAALCIAAIEADEAR